MEDWNSNQNTSTDDNFVPGSYNRKIYVVYNPVDNAMEEAAQAAMDDMIEHAIASKLASLQDVFGTIVPGESSVTEQYAKQEIPAPPTLAKLFLWLCMKQEDREVLLGDLEQMYDQALNDIGPDYARTVYWSRTIEAVWPILKAWLVKWGAIGIISKWLIR